MAALAKKYSVDSSAPRGGTYGCFAPTSTAYASVRNDIGTTPVGHFPSSPLSYTPTAGGTTYGLYVGATSRKAATLVQAEVHVITDIQTANATAASAVRSGILYTAAVAVNPDYGRWGLASTGAKVFAPGLPTQTGPATSSQLTTASTTPYQ